MNKKRVIFMIGRLIGGGAEKMVLLISEEIAKNNEVHLILHDPCSNAYPIPNSINVHHLSKTPHLSKFNLINRIKFISRCKKTLKNIENKFGKIDAIFANLMGSERIIHQCGGYQRFYVIHCNYTVEQKGKSKYKRRMDLARRIYNGSNLITVSEGIKYDILNNLKATPASITNIYNGLNISAMQLLANEPDKNIPEQPFIICAARASKQKRLDILLKAYKLSGVSHKLVILTNANEWLLNLIEELDLKNNVILPGFQANPYNWMKHADLFVLSSDFEGLPTVLIESLICGTQVVSTDCPSGPSEILTDELAQFLCPPGDPAALAEKIKFGLESNLEIKPEYYERFSIENCAQQYLDLIDHTRYLNSKN